MRRYALLLLALLLAGCSESESRAYVACKRAGGYWLSNGNGVVPALSDESCVRPLPMRVVVDTTSWRQP